MKKTMYFLEFKKFTDPDHPDYIFYKDRKDEMMHDKGWNNALDTVLKEITGEYIEPWETRLQNLLK